MCKRVSLTGHCSQKSGSRKVINEPEECHWRIDHLKVRNFEMLVGSVHRRNEIK